jgi:hypothetical protein
MFKPDNTFWGVYSPKGELEAVENSEGSAMRSATNLSPDKQRPDRVVKRVTVMCGDTYEEVDPNQLELEGFIAATKRRLNDEAAEEHRLTGEAIRRAKIKAQDPASGATSL